MNPSRRAFLRRAGITVGSAAVASTLDSLNLTSALAQGPGYKALVCVFLNGGNDSNNMLIPLGNNANEFPLYQAARQASGTAPNGLFYTQAQLTPTQVTPANLGRPFALHPNLASAYQTNPSILQLWNQNPSKVAAVCNVGPLIRPLHNLPGQTPRQAFQNNSNLRPYQLFSHSDQQQEYQTSVSDKHVFSGWGGRISDRFAPHPSGFPLMTTVSNVTFFTIGVSTRPLAVPGSGNLNGVLSLAGYGNINQNPEMQRRLAFDALRATGRSNTLVRATGDVMTQAIQIAQELSVTPTINTTFPTNFALGTQLLQVARLIKLNRDQPGLGLTRQIFFTQIGGFDTHQNQIANQGNLMTQISQSVGSFYQSMVELGMQDNVTLFTLSDFNRTFNPAGAGASAGSDHAWASHQLVIGGAVRGRNFYGTPYNGSPFPDLRMGNAGTMDTDTRGRWVPTTSVDQYAATLAAWFGVAQPDLGSIVFPYLDRFSPDNLGFMA